MLVAVAMVATAWSQGVADFAFPRKVSAEALTQLDRAMRSGDGNAVVDAMIRYSIAQSSISKQSIDTIMPRIEQLAAKEKRADIKALLYCLEATVLRRYRDNTLAETRCGRAFIRFYYAVSPTLVRWFGKTEWFRSLWKPMLDRMVKRLNDKGVENTPYADQRR